MNILLKWELWIKALTLLSVLGAGVWTVVSYKDSKKQEFYAEFWNKKMSVFQKTSKAASSLVTASNLEEFNRSRTEFWQLFYGEMSFFEGHCVKRAMEVFSQCVPEVDISNSALLPYSHLKDFSYTLTIRLKNELALAWDSPFSELHLSDQADICNFPEKEECPPR